MKLRRKGFAKSVLCLDTCSEPERSWQLLKHAPPFIRPWMGPTLEIDGLFPPCFVFVHFPDGVN